MDLFVMDALEIHQCNNNWAKKYKKVPTIAEAAPFEMVETVCCQHRARSCHKLTPKFP